MSVSTPILTTLLDKKGSIWAEAVAVSAKVPAKPRITASLIGNSFRVACQIGILLERQRHILGQSHRAPQSAGLISHSRPSQDGIPPFGLDLPQAFARDQHAAAGGR